MECEAFKTLPEACPEPVEGKQSPRELGISSGYTCPPTRFASGTTLALPARASVVAGGARENKSALAMTYVR